MGDDGCPGDCGGCRHADPTRREVLGVAWLASLGTFAAELGWVAHRFARRPAGAAAPGDPSPWVALGPVEALPGPGDSPRAVARGGFWWVSTGAGAVALVNFCPHRGCRYDWKVHENLFICPCHGLMMERDGAFVRGPRTHVVPNRRRLRDPHHAIPARPTAGVFLGARGADRAVIRAFDPDGREAARTNDRGDPLVIPPGSLVVIDPTTLVIGAPAPPP